VNAQQFSLEKVKVEEAEGGLEKKLVNFNGGVSEKKGLRGKGKKTRISERNPNLT